MELQTKIEKIKDYLKKAGHTFIILLALGAGFVIGFIYKEYLKKKVDANPFLHIYVMPKTSVALNEKNQLIIVNMEDGSYRVYEDSIGWNIFNQYAAKMFVKEQQSVQPAQIKYVAPNKTTVPSKSK